MTKEEILAMKPGREMDAFVAVNIFGWRWYNPEEDYNPDFKICIPPHYCPYGDYDEWGYVLGHGFYQFVKPYSTDISAAWEVVNKLKETYGVEIYVEQEIVICRLFSEITEAPTELEIISNTVPEAICKAALLAKLKEE